MPTAAPHVKLLRQLSDARDDYRSGALDVDWDGGRATLFMVFGQPSHAVFEEKGRGKVEGNAALAALLRELPPRFEVEPWRRAMTPSETLHCTVDDLVHHFAELAAAHGPGGAQDDEPSPQRPAGDDSPDLPYDLTSFPLLPDGDSVAAPTTPAGGVDVAGLAELLGTGLITLTGPRLRAAATVLNGHLADAVWVDGESHARGESAAMAILGAREGTVSGLRVAAEVVDALPMLWRLQVEQEAMNLRWLNPEALMVSFMRADEDRAVLVDAKNRGVGLFVAGAMVAAYSADRRGPTSDPLNFQALLSQPEGRITVLRRQTREATRAAKRPAAVAPVSPPADPEPAQPPPPFYSPPDAEPPATDIGGDLGVDFAEVRRELVQISAAWLGDEHSGRVVALIQQTRASVDDFVTMIDTVRSLDIPGCDRSLIEGMARELQVRAAERLCAA